MTNNDDEQTYNTNAAGRRLPSTAWKPGGPSPNPAGRGHVPSKFSKKFLVSLAASWEQHGDAVFEEVRRKDVVQYLRICASLIPKEVLVITHSTTPAAQLSEQELQAILVEDISAIERVRAAMLPLVSRVAELDQQLADDIARVLADG
jgi:hypothetical protein